MASNEKNETRDAKADHKADVKLAAVPASGAGAPPAGAAAPAPSTGAAAAVAPAPRPRDAQRDKAIELAVSTIEKQFGKGSIMRLGEDATAPEVQVVSTGSLGLDIALGVGGLPRGRIVEVYGPESSGKTTLALHAAAQAQRSGGICAFVDAEHA